MTKTEIASSLKCVFGLNMRFQVSKGLAVSKILCVTLALSVLTSLWPTPQLYITCALNIANTLCAGELVIFLFPIMSTVRACASRDRPCDTTPFANSFKGWFSFSATSYSQGQAQVPTANLRLQFVCSFCQIVSEALGYLYRIL